jgi:cytochrome P450
MKPNAEPGPAAKAEHEYHDYSTNRIPWYVRLMWIGFWVFAAYYAVRYLFPYLQVELLAPP